MNSTKQAIFEASIKEFSHNGFTGTTVDQIAITAGVAKGTLYYHFSSKEEIFNFLITHGMEIFIEQLNSMMTENDDILKTLKKLCKAQLSIVQQNKDFFKVVMSQLWGQELRHLQLREIVRRYLERIESRILRGMNEGSVKESDSKFMSYYFFGTLCSSAIYELFNEGTDLDKMVDDLIDYWLNGIKA